MRPRKSNGPWCGRRDLRRDVFTLGESERRSRRTARGDVAEALLAEAPTLPRGANAPNPQTLAHEGDRLFGAGDDTKAAGLTLVGCGRVGGLSAVGHALQASEQGQAREVRVVDPTNLEDIVRADLDAVLFAFAARVVDDGPVRSGLGLALLAGSLGV